MFVLVAHFTEPAPAAALAMLAVQPTCLRLTFAQSTDEVDRYLLIAEFAGPAGYRHALSPFEVRTTVIPWLSTALPGSGVSEALLTAIAGDITEHQPTVTPGR
ncbi:MAG: antibiotic biosynthesis monooxygenase [Actinomycetota bacterium]|nr:antibiotic biosynthesis monooxygenase [Actinomycetota bacterium]